MAHSDADLFARGVATLLASWEAYANGCDGAELRRLAGVSVAVFPSGPERAFYNNALIERGLGRDAGAAAVEATEAAYRSAGIDHYAVWVHEGDEAMRDELGHRGYTVEESTRAMGLSLSLSDAARASADIELSPPDWEEYLRLLGVPGLLRGADPSVFHVLIARLAGENVATAMAFDHAGDCGVFNVTTLEPARRRGLGTALTALHLGDAARRGCQTASLQSTPMAERVYASVGFRDLGQFLEFAH